MVFIKAESMENVLPLSKLRGMRRKINGKRATMKKKYKNSCTHQIEIRRFCTEFH